MTFIEIRKRRWLGLCRLIKTTLIPLERRMLLAMLLNLVLASFVFLSFIRDGSAGITSSFIRSEWPAVDIPLDHEAFAVPKGYNAPQQVSLQKSNKADFIIYSLIVFNETLTRILLLGNQIGHVKQFQVLNLFLYSNEAQLH